jgi:Tol biopolymer transport system component
VGSTRQFDLYLMNEHGTNVRRPTSDSAEERFPVFSPVANQIAFVRIVTRQSPVCSRCTCSTSTPTIHLAVFDA